MTVKHFYTFIENNGGVCACGTYVSWYGRITSPGVELAKHITDFEADDNWENEGGQ